MSVVDFENYKNSVERYVSHQESPALLADALRHHFAEPPSEDRYRPDYVDAYAKLPVPILKDFVRQAKGHNVSLFRNMLLSGASFVAGAGALANGFNEAAGVATAVVLWGVYKMRNAMQASDKLRSQALDLINK